MTLYVKKNIQAMNQSTNVQNWVVTNAAKAAATVKKPVSTFIPTAAPVLVVGVVLVFELVVDAPAVAEVSMVPVVACL